MRIEVSDPKLVGDLGVFLQGSGCRAVVRGANVLEAEVDWPDRAYRLASVERVIVLGLLREWSELHPGASVQVLGPAAA